VLVLDAHDSTSPDSLVGLVFVEVNLESLGKSLQVLVVFLLHLGKGDTGGGLLVHELAESCLTLDEAVGDALLLAESGQEHQQFDWIDVVGHHNELGLAIFDEGSHVVETELDVQGLGGAELLGTCLLLLLLALGLSLLEESLLLLLLVLGTVLSQQLKQLGCLVLVDGVLELMESGGHLESLKKNSLLTLQSDVLRPLDESGQVSLWLDVSTYSEVSGVLSEQGALHSLVAALGAG